jgi:PhnB protein
MEKIMKVEPYLFFEGRCEEAIEFYRVALGAKITMLMRYKDSPEPLPSEMCAPSQVEDVMHASFVIGETTVMASDGLGNGKPVFQGVSRSLTPTTVAEANRLFAALSENGRVHMPMSKPSTPPRLAWSSTGLACHGWSMRWPERISSLLARHNSSQRTFHD